MLVVSGTLFRITRPTDIPAAFAQGSIPFLEPQVRKVARSLKHWAWRPGLGSCERHPESRRREAGDKNRPCFLISKSISWRTLFLSSGARPSKLPSRCPWVFIRLLKGALIRLRDWRQITQQPRSRYPCFSIKAAGVHSCGCCVSPPSPTMVSLTQTGHININLRLIPIDPRDLRQWPRVCLTFSDIRMTYACFS